MIWIKLDKWMNSNLYHILNKLCETEQKKKKLMSRYDIDCGTNLTLKSVWCSALNTIKRIYDINHY